MGATHMADAAVELEVMNLERFATHDGPGIRTAVFLKGCPLRCPWCANPETQKMESVLFHDVERCVGCGACERACADGAICIDGEAFTYDGHRCSECGACVRACLHEALELVGKTRTIAEVLEECERDRDYYEASGGGVTLSGGEPLLRCSSALAFLREARRRGLSTAVETTGNVPAKTIAAVMPYVDWFLYDFKHIDSDVLACVTKGNGALIQGNLMQLAKQYPEKINVRIPVIPGFNYDDKTLASMLGWLRDIGVRRVNLLPYHTLGKNKYRKLGWDYTVPGASLRDEDLAPFHELALSLGLESKIGA